MTKLRIFLVVVAALLQLMPLRVATAGGLTPSNPTIPEGAQLISSGEEWVMVNGKQELIKYAVYQIVPPNLELLAGVQQEYVCGITVTALGGTGIFEQHVVATFSSTIPVGWQWNNGWTVTSSSFGWWWTNVTNPPFIVSGYNQSFTTQGTSIVNGTIIYALAPDYTSFYIRANYDTSSVLPLQPIFSCQSDRGRFSPPG